jgi:hypothetical protein
LFAGGEFTTAGGSSANYVAQWNGAAWSALGSGTDSSVLALAFDGSGNLLAGGSFATAGGQSARVALWNGTAWSPLGVAEAHPLGSVRSLSSYGGRTVAGGHGVYVWDTGAIAEGALQVAAAADAGDVWLVSKSHGHQVELRHYSTSWAAPAVLANGVVSGDIGVLFDTLNQRGMGLWASGADIVKTDFDKSSVAGSTDPVQASTRGLFAVGDAGDGATFPVLYIDPSMGLGRRTVDSDIP